MEDVISRSGLVTPAEVRQLSERRDAPALERAALHFGLIAVALFAAVACPWLGPRALGLLVAGVLWGLLFGPLHESMHLTAFRTRWMNEALYLVCCVLHFYAPTNYRAFHWEHHRHTHEPDRDPEIAPAPAILGAFPRSRIAHLVLMSGIHLCVLKIGLLIGQATGAPRLYQTFIPYLPENRRRRVAWEARGLLAVWSGCVAAGILLWPPLLILVALQVLGHAALSPLLMAEHHGLPHEGDVLQRTRSIHTSRLLRYFFWNMPLHAEHHGWPSIPFHALPQLHDVVKGSLPHSGDGYLAIHLRGRNPR